MMQMIDTPAARQFVPNSEDALQAEPLPVAPIYHITRSIVVLRGQKVLRASLRSKIATQGMVADSAMLAQQES